MDKADLNGDFYVVGVGASAGGLDALERLFSTAQTSKKLAFVIVQHLSPDYKSLMAELLSKRTEMPVHVAEDGMAVESGHVYLIPPNKSITIFHKQLFLATRESGLLYLPIDIFFQSLADDLGDKAIGVILSGTGSDGTRGIRAIKEKGGLVIVQEADTAKFDGMPRSAIATNLVDYISPPEEIVREILNFLQHPLLKVDTSVSLGISHDTDSLNKIFALLRSMSGVDFSNYKQNTMLRRIERRMGVKRVEKLSDYLFLLHQNPSEANTLYREFLIGVTRFFRDEESFKFLKEEVIPGLFKNKTRGESLRVWVAGCSTGEEAYSLAILLTEYMEVAGKYLDIKVFATDLDKNALSYASKGVYPESIAADISLDYLKNYFIKQEEHYAVSRRVREMVIFAKQNMITDPPFSKVDMISCRNVLIYLQPVLQRKVLAAFQFALNDKGYLFLGSSETLGDMEEFFHVLHTKWKIYQFKGGYRPSIETNRVYSTGFRDTLQRIPAYRPATSSGAEERIQRALIEAFLPPAVVVDEEMRVLYLSGDVDAYLRLPQGGLFTASILKQARDGLAVPLSTAIHKVIKERKEITYRNIKVEFGESIKQVHITAKPYTRSNLHQSQENLVLLLFTPVADEDQIGENETVEHFDISSSARQRIQDLEYELQHTRESLQATVEELETSNEELQATNEELFAANEELQSTNEELHSVNEELITVNAEYHTKIQELTQLNDDINNLLYSTNIGTIFVDKNFKVRLFTPAAKKEINLLEQDVGRPLSHITYNLVDCDLYAEAKAVLETLESKEMVVRNSEGNWYQLKVMPYHTLQGQVGGVAISLADITDLTEANLELSKISSVMNNGQISVIITNPDGEIEYVNPEFMSLTGYSLDEVKGKTPAVLKSGDTLEEEYKKLWGTITAGKVWSGAFRNKKKNGESYWAHAIISPVKDQDGTVTHFVAVQDDITAQRDAELALDASSEKYQSLLDMIPFGVTLADHEGKIIASNQVAETILGVSQDEQAKRDIDGKEWQIIRRDGSVFPAEEYPSVRALKEKEIVGDVEMGIVKEKDEITWISVTAKPLDSGVAVIYYLLNE